MIINAVVNACNMHFKLKPLFVEEYFRRIGIKKKFIFKKNLNQKMS